ncbi:aldo/keto reductase [Actinacidiphila guanduensis]|uniref:Predicted oxidoreductase n=1 Tax=Actinacidiphila guanduensis TaxID=310781 RepID=A0A1G9XEV1_9ACTN|nr:aldo/keto reductase [Actinacidiphila guanduensis]SDM95258.1 Predicted oxidoreductase [Actinacidiphila guanduensis]
MEYRQLGGTGVFVSSIALGAMTFGGADSPIWGTVGGLGAQEADAIVGAALDAGVNLVDTADVYGDGESESILGKVLGSRRDDVVLATKASARTGPGPNDAGATRYHLLRSIEASLSRLGTDRIDLFQIHGFDPLTPLEETLGALDDAVRQGKVRYIGASNFAARQLVKALGVSAREGLARFVSHQCYYSLVGRDVEHEILPASREENVAFLSYAPLASGLLSGKFDRSGATEEGARRNTTDWPPTDREKAYDAVDVLRVVAGRHGTTVARAALAWNIAQPGVTSAIVGARRVPQLLDSLGAVEVALTAQDLAELDAATAPPTAYPAWIQQQVAPSRLPQA